VTGFVHLEGANAQDHFVSCAAGGDELCCVCLGGEMDMRSRTAKDPFTQNGVDEPLHGAVIERGRRLAWREAEIDVERVSLVGADASAIWGEGETLLVTRCYDFFELVGVYGFALYGC
jgi:hypothetical protein